MEGDFNKTVMDVLKSDRLTRRAAIFALLDQRNTECHWATVQALAARKGTHKIELMYFCGISWLHRSLKTSARPERIREIDLWWGGDGWREMMALTQVEAIRFLSNRFERELQYKHVHFYPIFSTENTRKPAFFLIHASDHDQAPKLMARAYKKILGDRAGTPADSQLSLF